MKYISSTKGSFVALVILTILGFLLPIQKPIEGLNLVLTVTTFLFAILVGFDLSRLYSRYTNVRQAIAEEDARMLSFFAKSKIYGKQFSNKIKKLISRYYINALDFGIWKSEGYYYKATAKYFLSLYDEMEKIKKHCHEGTYESMLDDLSYAEAARNKSSVFIYSQVSLRKQYFLFILSFIILFCLFFNVRGLELYSKIITILLSSSLVLIILILRDLNNFMLQSKGVTVESRQEVLEFIGEPRYYNKLNIKRGYTFVPKEVKEYRLGLHKPGQKQKIETIKR
jgi:hypothetical protein